MAAAKFPPLGERSWGPHRAMMLGGMSDPRAHLREANDMTVTIAMIETRAALKNLDAIAAVDGIDAMFVGPSDLSIAMSEAPYSIRNPRSRGAARQDRRGGAEGRQNSRCLLRDWPARGGDGQARLQLSRRRQRPRLLPRGLAAQMKMLKG